MGRGKQVKVCAAGLACIFGLSGCVSLSEYRRVRAQNNTLIVEKATLEQSLVDERTVADSLRSRVGSLEREAEASGALADNLRRENELLDQMRRSAQGALEEMAGRQGLGDITISGPKLPQPLDTAIRHFADEHPSIVEYDPAKGIVKWKADLLFALGSDVVKDTSLESLQSFAEVLKSPVAADFEAVIVGHTCTRPIVRPETRAKHPTNWHLSAHRAISVAFALQKYGYPAERVGIMGYGEYRPVADNATEAGGSMNRRVEIYIVPRGTLQRGADNDRGDGQWLTFAAAAR